MIVNINRNNYESWFLDYLDGKLNAGQKERLMLFLEFNPDLKLELEGLEMVHLEAENVSYQQKKILIKPVESPSDEIIPSEFETLCISSIENQLSPEEESDFKDVLETDPEKRKTYSLYLSTIIKADRSIFYPGKSLLTKRFIDIPTVRIMASAVAASAVIFLAVSVLLRNPSGPETLIGNQEITHPGENTHEKEITEEILSETSEEKQVKETIETKPMQAKSIDMEQFRAEAKTSPLITAETIRPPSVHLSAMNPIEAKNISHGEGIRQRSVTYSMQEHSITPSDELSSPERGERRISFWKLADAGIQRINEMSEEDYSLDRKVDEQGYTRRFTFETPIFGISTPLGSTDQPQ